jgi:hypothetical protein
LPQVPHFGSGSGPSGVIGPVRLLHVPLRHCTPSVHGAPASSAPKNAQASGGPAGNSQADESSALAQASSVVSFTPLPGRFF